MGVDRQDAGPEPSHTGFDLSTASTKSTSSAPPNRREVDHQDAGQSLPTPVLILALLRRNSPAVPLPKSEGVDRQDAGPRELPHRL